MSYVREVPKDRRRSIWECMLVLREEKGGDME